MRCPVKARSLAVCAAAVLCSAFAVAPLGAQSSSQGSSGSQPRNQVVSNPLRPPRVHVHLEGFDIAPKSGKAPNQIGGASRGLGGVTLLAPTMGKAYSLTPTFYWSNDDKEAQFTFKLSAMDAVQSPLYTTKVKGNSLTYPADAPALKPGATYVWSVEPEIDMMGGPASASVLIVGGAERAALAAKLEAARDANEHPTAAEAKAMVDARIWYDAVWSYTELIARHPERSELYESRAELYDQVPATAALADADAAKAPK